MTTTAKSSSAVNTVRKPAKTSFLTAARDAYRDRRSERAMYHRVEQELSTYTSAAEIQELEAMLERSTADADSVYTQMIERVRLRAA